MGEYESANGQKVQFTDGSTVQLVMDLYQYIEHDYKGSPSIDAARLETIVKNLGAGKPLEQGEWDILNSIRKRVGPEFDRWRASGRDGENAMVPPGPGRLSEACLLMPASTLRRLQEQYATPSTTTKDKDISAAHLLDSVLHDLAHTRQHVARILEPDVLRSRDSTKFNAEHALNHADSAQDHAHKLDKHLSQTASNPRIWTDERKTLHTMRAMQEAEISTAPHRVTVAVDFDGVIHQGPHGLPGKVQGVLIEGAAAGLHRLAQDFKVVVYTARRDLDAVKVWLEDQGVAQDVSAITNVKPVAAAYIDDRAIPFTSWQNIPEAVDERIATEFNIQEHSIATG